MIDTLLAALTINIAPSFELGPLTMTWHGMMTALGIVLAAWIAVGFADRRGLDGERVITLALITAVAGIAGARLFYLALNDAAALLRPADWLGTNGFAIFGGVFAGVAAAAAAIHWSKLSWRYLDALAVGFPLGLAVGRIGDLINGEHYGPPSDAPWAVIHANPAAIVPSPDVAYHDGGLYEIVLGLAIFAVIWPLRDRFATPTMLLWLALGLYGIGRFAMFFYRSDSDPLALGLNAAQGVSALLVAIAAVGAWWSWRRLRSADREPSLELAHRGAGASPPRGPL